MTRASRTRTIAGVVAALFLVVASCVASRPAAAKPRNPDPEPPQPPKSTARSSPAPLPLLTREERLPDGYQDLVRRLMQRGPADTLGDGLFAMAEEAFYAGEFEQATARYVEFVQHFPRNLRLNLALERMLLIKDGRDFEDQPIRIYARAEGMRAAGHPDSAEAALAAGLTRYPGARLRYHYHLAMAEIARDRGNHALAVEHALAVADTAAASRLAPAALQLAGDETLAAGGPVERASAYYQALLERFPDSPLAAGVRAHLLLLRKKMQL